MLRFATPMDLFDRDFPGHYLRLIKRVSTSVIALIPPSQGIRATLATTGTSRVVIGGDAFQTVVLQRGPELVALSSPANATGLFTLDAQSDLLVPFEGIGVDTTWELQMPKAANPFDYSTIADVLVSIDYTALYSPDYRERVTRQLDLSVSADRGYSFRYQFADQWYELHNPQQSDTPMAVTFTTERDDFPPNVSDLHIRNVVLYFARADGQSFEVAANLQFTYTYTKADGTTATSTVGGDATSVNGVMSTRTGSASSWSGSGMIGPVPYGEWKLNLSIPQPGATT